MLLRTPPAPSRSFLRTLIAFTFTALLLFTAGQASATGMYGGGWGHDDDRPSWRPPVDLPGISLGRLVAGGGSFTSRNGEVIFSDFDANVRGIGIRNLDLYRVIPISDGFKLWTPLVSALGKNSGLELTYSVDAADGLLLDSASLSLQSAAIFGKTFASMDLFDGDDLIAELDVSGRGLFGKGRYHGRHGGGGKSNRRDEVTFEAIAGLTVDEVIGLKTGLLAATRKVTHRFGTQVIPEPGTALLMGLGLAGLAIAGGRKGRSPSA